jgi:hypothetical protein
MKFILFFTSFFFCFIGNSQPIIRTTISPPNTDTTYWAKENKVGLDFTQIAFSNWNAGGNSSVSGLARGTFGRKYTKGNVLWNNELLMRYGINKQEDRELRKTDDQFLINSNFGYKKSPNSKWFYSGRFNFTSQFVEGYAYPNKEVAISLPFAPAYIFLGVGSEFNDKNKNFNVYMSPMTVKGTLVWNQRLADQGAFGVDRAVFDEEGNLLRRGSRHRTEMGILLNNYWKKEIYKNIVFENRATVFADYLGRFGNIDIDWQMQLDMTINEYVRANVGIHMIYDDDIKAKKEIDGQQVTVGPRLQLKQMLGVGMIYQF